MKTFLVLYVIFCLSSWSLAQKASEKQQVATATAKEL
jgi:hypothetical protein